jgi:membrane fusion protein (multidrug efflux system)
MVGNDYVLHGGLKAGEQLVVAGVQKIGDGMPVQATPAASTAPVTGAPGAPREGAKP